MLVPGSWAPQNVAQRGRCWHLLLRHTPAWLDTIWCLCRPAPFHLTRSCLETAATPPRSRQAAHSLAGYHNGHRSASCGHNLVFGTKSSALEDDRRAGALTPPSLWCYGNREHQDAEMGPMFNLQRPVKGRDTSLST